MHRRRPRASCCEAAVKAGAPEGIIGWIDVPSPGTDQRADARGGHHSGDGRPRHGHRRRIPPANRRWASARATPRPSSTRRADIKLAVNSIIHSKTFDNGMICASEQSVIGAGRHLRRSAARSSQRRGCYFLKGDELDKVRNTIFINGALNAKIVGQSAHTIAQLAGVDVPENDEDPHRRGGKRRAFRRDSRTRNSPRCWRCTTRRISTRRSTRPKRWSADGGHGHTASLYIHAGAEGKDHEARGAHGRPAAS